jgi:hypothetical protein
MRLRGHSFLWWFGLLTLVSVASVLAAFALILADVFPLKRDASTEGPTCYLRADMLVSIRCENFPGAKVASYVFTRGSFPIYNWFITPILIVELAVIAILAGIFRLVFWEQPQR